MKFLITGSSGLIGSTAARFFCELGNEVIGIDNNQRQKFFGKQGSTDATRKKLEALKNYRHLELDITSKTKVEQLFRQDRFDAIIHCAAQPSHDRAKDFPFLDYSTNSTATIWLLEMMRQHNPEATFIFTSTNKVYGDNPNKVPLKELDTRYWFANPKMVGIDETCPLDDCTHSLFGAGKLSADVYVQEYGRYFGLNTACLRLGCVTGANHAGVVQHGFLSYLIKSVMSTRSYTIIGYKGKQVRDQIDAFDVVTAMEKIIKRPVQGTAFNLGGGSENAASILELLQKLELRLGHAISVTYVDEPRVGDHICYSTDYSKFKSIYPDWGISRSLDSIIESIIEAETV